MAADAVVERVHLQPHHVGGPQRRRFLEPFQRRLVVTEAEVDLRDQRG